MTHRKSKSSRNRWAEFTRRHFIQLAAAGAALPAIEPLFDFTSSSVTAQSNLPLPRDGRTRIKGPVPDSRIGELMKVDARGGTVIELDKFDLSKPGASWSYNDLEMVYEDIPGTSYGCYRLISLKPTKGSQRNQLASSGGWFAPKPNRMYVISVLINCDFERNADEQTEINVGEFTPATDVPKEDPQQRYGAAHWNGVPNKTNGWIRWEWEFPSVTCGKAMSFYMLVFQFLAERQFRIADAKFIELPAKPLVPYDKGKGVTFRGGPGNLPMQVYSPKQSGSALKIRTTGATYTFDTGANTITVEQMLEKRRTVVVWQSSLSLADLQVQKQTSSVCILTSAAASFGIQCDSMMMVAPHQELSLTCESKIGGVWNRLFSGHLNSIDDWGGFAVNPDIPVGSGRLVRVEPLTDNLDFVGVASNVNFESKAQPGWKVRWTLSPGERLAISVFPPRPYPWKESFDIRPAITYYALDPAEYAKLPKDLFTVAVGWEWCIHGYGMSFGSRYIPKNENKVRAHIAALKAVGIKPCNYISPHFYWSRNAREYIDEVQRWKTEYGIEGVYCDGNPSQEWIVAYEEMRMLRQLFPDGPIILHSTGQMDGGGAPLSMPDIFQPFIDTYATATIRGEYIINSRKDAPYHRYVTSQYRKANCIGIQKGDRWQGLTLAEQDKIMLNYNGRTWNTIFYPIDEYSHYRNTYYPVLMQLKRLWEEKGSEPNFYEKYYLPKVRELTSNPLGT